MRVAILNKDAIDQHCAGIVFALSEGFVNQYFRGTLKQTLSLNPTVRASLSLAQ